MSYSDASSVSVKRQSSLLNAEVLEPEEKKPLLQNPLRPKSLKDYPGQEKVKENLAVYIQAAQLRKHCMDHVILHGPPGLGKTTMAHIIAAELGVPFHATSGPAIDKPGDLAGLLASLEEGAVLFIDEIHRLTIQVEEILYAAMEDFKIDIIIGQGQTAKSITMPLAPFTLIGATTRLSSLSRPFLNRFGIVEKMEYYPVEALLEIIKRSSVLMGIQLSQEGAYELALRSRGTPRIANRLLKRVRDFSDVFSLEQGLDSDRLATQTINQSVVQHALTRLDIDKNGLDLMDRKMLFTIATQFKGGPVGIDTLAASLGEEKATLEDVYEPFLMHQGFINRGPRGRSITSKAKKWLSSLIEDESIN